MPNKTAPTSGDTATDPSSPDGVSTDPYDSLKTSGTVTVVQQPANTQPDAVVKTNETWARDGAQWLTTSKGVPGSEAIAALTKYINGEDRSFQEKEWIDAVIGEKGSPPESVSIGGNTSDKPAQKQFDTAPGVHTVKGGSDNTYAKLAVLYYGSSTGDTEDLIQNANPSLPSTSGPFSAGT